MSRERKRQKEANRKEDMEDSRLSTNLGYKKDIWNTDINTGHWLPKDCNHLQARTVQETFSVFFFFLPHKTCLVVALEASKTESKTPKKWGACVVCLSLTSIKHPWFLLLDRWKAEKQVLICGFELSWGSLHPTWEPIPYMYSPPY